MRKENNFKLAITPNYEKIIWQLVAFFVGIIIPIILFGIALSQGLLNPADIPFEFVLPAYIIFTSVATYFVIRKTHFTDTITLTDNALQIPKLRNIFYQDITKNKEFTAKRITSYIITLKDGKKIAIGSTDNYSDSANQTFRDFIAEFERRIEDKI